MKILYDRILWFGFISIIFFLSGCAVQQPVRQNSEMDRRSCEVLDRGNQALVKGEYELAGRLYAQIQPIDQVGRGACTSSVYASLATTWLIRGNAERERNPALAATYYKRAAFWNRAFANAVECKNGDCTVAQSFWDKRGDIWRDQ